MKKGHFSKIIKITLPFVISFSFVGLVGCTNVLTNSTINDTDSNAATPSENMKNPQETSTDNLFFTTQYYIDENASTPSEKTTLVKYDEKTKIYTIEELGFSKEGQHFKGWMIYRDSDNKWYVKNKKNNKTTWIEKDGDSLPNDYEYDLRNDGGTLRKASKSGIVKLFGVWESEK